MPSIVPKLRQGVVRHRVTEVVCNDEGRGAAPSFVENRATP